MTKKYTSTKKQNDDHSHLSQLAREGSKNRNQKYLIDQMIHQTIAKIQTMERLHKLTI